eukprot:m.31687 g.31687  ORF g.31687 m.31687 type:complete len:266 (-) comp8338_c0_seq1:2051-2848(-)
MTTNMVSLNSSRSQGAVFFNNSDKEDTYLLTVPQKGLDKNGGTSSKDFTGHINTLPSATLQAVALTAMEIVIFVPEKVIQKMRLRHSAFETFALFHAILWTIVALVSWHMAYCHRRSRIRGYLNFYRNTQIGRRLPFFVTSLGSTVLLVLAAGFGDKASTNILLALKMVYTVEYIVVAPAVLTYIYKVYKFNEHRDRPDVLKELLSRVNTKSISADDELACDADLDDVLEKQADIIRFMKQHNESLSNRIRDLTEQLDGFERGIQ